MSLYERMKEKEVRVFDVAQEVDVPTQKILIRDAITIAEQEAVKVGNHMVRMALDSLLEHGHGGGNFRRLIEQVRGEHS